jgi:hypothetical protein
LAAQPLARVALEHLRVDSPVGVDPVEHELLPLEHAQKLPRRLHGAAHRKLLRITDQCRDDLAEVRACGDGVGLAWERVGRYLAARCRERGQPTADPHQLDEVGAGLLERDDGGPVDARPVGKMAREILRPPVLRAEDDS